MPWCCCCCCVVLPACPPAWYCMYCRVVVLPSAPGHLPGSWASCAHAPSSSLPTAHGHGHRGEGRAAVVKRSHAALPPRPAMHIARMPSRHTSSLHPPLPASLLLARSLLLAPSPTHLALSLQAVEGAEAAFKSHSATGAILRRKQQHAREAAARMGGGRGCAWEAAAVAHMGGDRRHEEEHEGQGGQGVAAVSVTGCWQAVPQIPYKHPHANACEQLQLHGPW